MQYILWHLLQKSVKTNHFTNYLAFIAYQITHHNINKVFFTRKSVHCPSYSEAI